MRKLLTRTLTLGTILLLAYFVVISDETGKIPTEHAAGSTVSGHAVSIGEDVAMTTFNVKGEKTSTGTFAGVTQNVDDELWIEKPDVTYKTAKGRVIQVRADFLDTHEGGRQVLSSVEGNLILVREQDGITIETAGPLIFDPAQEVLFTDAHATFRMANFSGECVGLRYRSGSFLRLASDVLFQGATGKDGRLFMDAAFLELNLEEHVGKLDGGVITSEMGEERNVFTADTSRFFFVGDGSRTPYTLTDLRLQGAPARFQWGQGEVEASGFDGCFDSSGRWLERFTTSPDAVFTAVSEDGYWFTGKGGRMTVTAMAWQPQALRSADPVVVRGRKGDGPELYLEGRDGLETLFLEGEAGSTRIFGAPRFSYGRQEGSAGSLRVLHHEHQILFSQGALLHDAEQQVRIQGDEVLLADWDKPRREIYAFKFVEIKRFEGTAAEVTCFGDQLELRLPGGALKLGGSPARVVRTAETIEAATIELSQSDRDQFDMHADQGTILNMITDQGTFFAEARRMDYDGRKRLLTFENVSRVVVPERGELSGGLLEAWMVRDGDSLRLDRVRMSRDVVFKGSRLVDGVPRPVHCLADEMSYKVSEEVIYFHGINRDVVFSDAQVETRNRDLVYNLKDFSLSGYAGRNRPSTTTVPLGKSNKNDTNLNPL